MRSNHRVRSISTPRRQSKGKQSNFKRRRRKPPQEIRSRRRVRRHSIALPAGGVDAAAVVAAADFKIRLPRQVQLNRRRRPPSAERLWAAQHRNRSLFLVSHSRNIGEHNLLEKNTVSRVLLQLATFSRSAKRIHTRLPSRN